MKNPLKRSILVVKIGGSGGSEGREEGLEKRIAKCDLGPITLDEGTRGGTRVDCEKEEKKGANGC